MRVAKIVGLSVVALAVGTVSTVGCGSDKISPFDPTDSNDSGGGGPIFGGDGGPTNDAHACVGLECQQKACSGGGDTTVTGTVFAPNGTLPLYNAIVYVPNSEPDPVVRGATCDQCGAVTGNPVVTALSGSDGKFELKNVPVGKDIPLIIQIGKWRRQVVLPEVKACQANPITDKELTRLPKNQSEGSMPQMALTTGGCDKFGCMLPKIGIDPSEFGVEADGPSKAVHVFKGSSGGGPSGAPDAQDFWSDVTRLKQYDVVMLSCECQEALDNKGAAAFAAMTDYLNLGGRIFTTDFMYTWYKDSSDNNLKSAASIAGGAPAGGDPITFDSSFPKGEALVEWLQNVGATTTPGQLTPDVTFANVQSVDATKAQVWASSGSAGFGGGAGPRVFTVNLPVGVPTAQQCGKGVHLDAHLNQNGSDTVGNDYPAGCESALKPGENLLAFFFFDLASCIQNDSEAPKPPPVN
jgi:hypothetical protein